jgi:hypothetical protein
MALAMMCSKRDFRCLLRISQEFLVLPWLLFRDNILRNPPLVKLKSWLNVVTTIIGGLDLRVASKGLLADLITELYSDYGFTGLPHQFCPNLCHLEHKIRAKHFPLLSNLSRHRESLESRISHAILKHCGDIFNCNYGIDLVKLLETDFVLELDGLGQEMRQLLLTLLCSRIFMYRVAEGIRTQKLRTLIVLDDAQMLFRRVEEIQPDSEFSMGTIISQAREYGTGMVVCAQEVRDLAYSLTANTSLKLCFGFADKRDLEEFGRMV